jgi:glycosyltransferase involved in cell wall biosynthesis
MPVCDSSGGFSGKMHSAAPVRMIDRITPLVITYNEASNIARTLGRLTWARRIVVIDSGSTDETLDIIRSFPQAQVIHRNFDDCAS